MKQEQSQKITVREHLEELRKRLFWIVGIFMIGAIPGLLLTHFFTKLLVAPLGQNLYFSNPTGGLNFAMQICLITGLLVAIPVIIFHGVQFIRPLSTAIKTSLAIKIMTISGILAAIGVVYAYKISLPASLQFLTNFNGDYVKPLMSATDYLGFVMTYLVGSALIFQVPLVLYFINRIKPLKPGTLKRMQKPVIAGSVIFAGIITPTPDPYNQMMIALPLLILFEMSAFMIWALRGRQPKTATQAAPEKVQAPRPALAQVEYPEESLDFITSLGAPSLQPVTNSFTESLEVAPIHSSSDLQEEAPQASKAKTWQPLDPKRRVDAPRRTHTPTQVKTIKPLKPSVQKSTKPLFRDITPPNPQPIW
jgi:sec-independent protein translocase protein TatC